MFGMGTQQTKDGQQAKPGETQSARIERQKAQVALAKAAEAVAKQKSVIEAITTEIAGADADDEKGLTTLAHKRSTAQARLDALQHQVDSATAELEQKKTELADVEARDLVERVAQLRAARADLEQKAAIAAKQLRTYLAERSGKLGAIREELQREVAKLNAIRGEPVEAIAPSEWEFSAGYELSSAHAAVVNMDLRQALTKNDATVGVRADGKPPAEA